MIKRKRIEERELADRPEPGRPTYAPSDKDRQWVKFCCAMGAPKRSCCRILNIDEKTFDKHFALEIDEGRNQLGLTVAEEMMKRALDHETIQMKPKRKRGVIQYHKKGAKNERGESIEGEPIMVPTKVFIAGDNNLLLRLFNAWVNSEKVQTQQLGKNGKPIDPAAPTAVYATVNLPPNGRETGAGGDPSVTIRRQIAYMKAQLAKLGNNQVH